MSNDFWSTLNKKKKEELLKSTQTQASSSVSKTSEELKSGDFWSSLSAEKQQELLSSGKTSGTTKRTFMSDDDDIAPVLGDKSTVETTQAIFDKYGQYYNSPDYDEYSQKGAAIKNPSAKEAEGWASFFGKPIGGKEVGNIVTYSRDNYAEMKLGELNGGGSSVGKAIYYHMTDFEVGIYNYLLAKEGKDAAQEFLDDIEETLNAREGGMVAENIQNSGAVSSAILHGMVSVGSGVESFGTGVKQLFSEEALPTTSTEFLNQELLNDLDGFAKTAYQAGNTVGNMIPSTVAGIALSPVVGRILQGSSAAGNAYRESLKEGKTKEEAATYGVIVGSMEFITSKLIGGVEGMTGSLPQKALKKIATFQNGLLRVGAKYAVNIGSEITEEELQLWLEPFARQIAFGEDYDAPTLEEMAETAIVTALSTGILNSSTDIATGNLTKVNGLTQHEAKVVDKLYNDAIAEQESEEKKLTSKEKNELYDKVVEEMKRGYISTDEIESILGGKTYEGYKSLTEKQKSLEERKTAIEEEVKSLVKTPESQFTVEQRERLNSLREEAKGIEEQIKGMDVKSAKNNLFNEVNKLTAKDTYLRESYNEIARKGQAFKADLTKYTGKQREAIERAIDSGVLNNTNRSHELVDTLSKIEADKGIVFDYTNNAKLKESGFAIEGKTVNGFVKDGGVTLNVQSQKAWQSTVGHEITHVLEGTESYGALREALFAYAESKGELESRRTSLAEIYNGMDADIDAELTADLVGDYLFSDKDFINHLTGNRSLFQKVYDEIKYLCKVATGKELTEIEKVKREFDRAWKEQGQIAQNNELDTEFDNDDVNYSISVTDTETLNFLDEQISRGEYNAETNPDGGYYVTYKSMSFWGYDEDGNAILRSPMAEYVDGELSNAYLVPKDKSKLNWYKSTETIDENTGLPSGLMVKVKKDGNKSFSYLPAAENQDLINEDWSNLYFNLQKKVLKNGKWVNSDVPARYNPYEHSSNSMLNDQFSAAYLRDNLVTVKMYVPVSEDNGTFRAKYSKDATGWADWKTGTVAGKINKQKDLQRKVYLSRYAAPVEIVPDSEVAQAYKEYLDGTDVTIPDNVVSPNLLNELKKAGVPIEESGKVKYSLSKDNKGNNLTPEQQEYFKDSKVVDDNGNLKVMYHGSPNADFTVFKSGTYFTEHKWYADVYQNQGASSLGYKKTANNPDTYAVYLDIKKPFDTRNKAERDIFYNEYYRQWGTGTDLMESGLPDWMDGQDLQEFLEENGYDYDGLILDEGGVGGYGEEVTSRGLSYVVFSPEQVKNIDNPNPSSNPDIRYSLSTDTKKADAEYMSAIERGDTETAQKMVDEAAKNAGYGIKAYHGTGYDFTVFDKSKQGDNYQDWGRLGKGFYFAPTSREAETWAELSKGGKNKVMPVYLRSENMLDSFEPLPDNLKDTIPADWEGLTRRLAEKYAYNYIEYMQEFGYNVQQILTEKGYDGINGHTEFVVFDPEQVKSADTVTYDDKGNVIPLAERFNAANEDIRYSLSGEGEQFAPIGNYSTPLNETALEQDIAPVAEGVAENTPTQTVEDAEPDAPMPDEIVPMTEDEANTLQDEKANADAKLEGEPKTRKQLHSQILGRIKSVFKGKGFDFDDVLKNAKNLSTFSTVDNTPQRVMEKALGYKEGQALADLTVNKVAQNETEGIKWLNSFTDRKNGLLAQISKEYNIKPGSKESAAAQMYAEGFYVNEDNEIVEYGDRELEVDFPDAEVRNNIKGLAKEPRIRQIYDETLEAINKSRTRNAYPEIQKLDNYFLHFRAMEDTFSKLGLPFNPNDIRAKDLPTDLNGVTADLKPGQPYFASAMHRKGKRTSFDLLGGLERYLTSAKNQIYHIDDIQTLRALRNYIADTYGQAHGLESIDTLTEEEAQAKIEQVYGSHLSTFAKFLNEEANILAGKTALIDRGLEGIIGRRGITFLDTLNKQVGSNMVGYSASSAIVNFDAIPRAVAKSNKYDFLKAFAQTVSNKFSSTFGKGDNFAENSPVIIRRKGAERFYRTPFQKTADVGYVLMGAIDNISTEIIARTKFNELTRKGMSEQQAHFETDKWVSRLMGDRSLGQMPQLYNSKMLGLITKFQLEVRNNLDSQFYDTIQEAKVSNEEIENRLARNAKTAAKITSTFVQLAVAQHLFGKAFESIAGYNPSFDIISTLATMFGFDDDEESEDTVLDNIEQGFLELLEDLPYTSTFTGGRIPISSALPIKQFVTGKDSYGNEKSRIETLLETAPYYILPGGYGQIKKTYQGLNMFSDEHPVSGSYTDSGNLRFPVEDTLGNRIQAGVFGQYASKNAREYFDNGYAPLKEKQIQEYMDVDLPIADYWKYREGLSGLKTNEEKADYINSLDIENWQKNLLLNNILDRKEDVDMSNYDDYADFEEFDYAQKNPDKYAFAKSVGGYSAYKTYSDELYDIKADKDENGKSISGSRKEKVLNYINNLDADYETKIILWKSEYPSDDTYNMEIINYINNRTDLTYEERVSIFTELGFTVSNGSVYWD